MSDNLPRLKAEVVIDTDYACPRDLWIEIGSEELLGERKERMEVADACFERGWTLGRASYNGWLITDAGPADSYTPIVGEGPTPLAAWNAATGKGEGA